MQTAVQSAVERWGGIIVQGLPSQAVSMAGGSCFTTPAVGETVDDLVSDLEQALR